MIRHAIPLLPSAALALAVAAAAGGAPPRAAWTPQAIVAAAEAGDWAPVPAADLLVVDLANGRRVAIALAPAFAPAHAANIRALARAGWFDGAAVERVQDDYVTQWGDPDGRKPLPEGVSPRVPAEYERSAAGVPLATLPFRDTFAPRTGFVRGFPVAAAGGRAWLVHCYGMVGVGRDVSPDTGNGSELYAVIGHAPRALDRNIALVGRVVGGMEALAALPRGTGDLGFYSSPDQRLPVTRARMASDMPAGERPEFEWMRPDSAAFHAWVHARANRQDAFFIRPAGAVDLCNALPPVRPVQRGRR